MVCHSVCGSCCGGPGTQDSSSLQTQPPGFRADMWERSCSENTLGSQQFMGCSKGMCVYAGSLCPPGSLGVCRIPTGALCGASTRGQAPRASSSLWRGTVAGQSPPAQSCSMSLLQQPPALHDQPGVRCKSLGAILTTLPRKCGETLTFPASHSGEEDKPLFPFCSFLVLGKHLPIPAHSCLLLFQAELAK